jgi:hypothetical protein
MKKALKHIVLIVLTALYCLTFLRTLTPYMDYALNKEFIAEVLCVNQDKPELKCNGKCYLKEQLEQSAEKEQQEQQSSRSTEKENLFVSTASPINDLWNNIAIAEEMIFAEPQVHIEELAYTIPKPPPQA